ncbi:M14 family metallopeptidase [Vogesella oryzae]|uniref:M14 family metallopeptidase n=1 Tax=Vogesella oryzae TaxID=1735285 RepID=UPI001581C2FD|nr:M14 family metallopeptidase [Vogesella oryzae]
MQTKRHPLISDVPGTERCVISHHFGQPGSGRKVYLQAGLHADEHPGQLVLWHLLPLLQQAEDAGRLTGEVVVVPCANPTGLAQALYGEGIGRFELHSGENFNRHYPDLYPQLVTALTGRLGSDAAANCALVRQNMQALLQELQPQTELASLRRVLLQLACDADAVLDLHCDLEAVLHLYSTPSGELEAQALARHLGASVLLLAEVSGGNAFDEACSTTWDRLRTHFGAELPLGSGCFATTVELRGQCDVGDVVAAHDAAGLMDWLAEYGVFSQRGLTGPHPRAEACPLAGSEDLQAPVAGLLSFHVAPGSWLEAGDAVADIINPVSGERQTVRASQRGLLYARSDKRFTRRGESIAFVSGKQIRRSGHLLSA